MKSVFLFLSLPLLPMICELIFQQSFFVHDKGGVVITGASSGIGRHAAQALSALGYTVFAGVRKSSDADSLQKDIPQAVPIILDVTSQDSIFAARDKIRTTLKAKNLHLVAVVNNAGVQKDLPVELQTSASDRFTFDVNVFGVLDMTRAFIPMLRATGNGARIVNIGSLAGIIASPGSATYVASKFAVEGLTDALRMELAPFGISVSLIQPGYVFTQMGVKLHEKTTPRYGLSQESYALYSHVFEGFFKDDKANASPDVASSPQVTTDAIVDAIRSPAPRTRYAVANVGGIPASVVKWVKNVLPDRAMDMLQ